MVYFLPKYTTLGQNIIYIYEKDIYLVLLCKNLLFYFLSQKFKYDTVIKFYILANFNLYLIYLLFHLQILRKNTNNQLKI